MKSLDGYWKGAIEIPNQPLLIIAEFDKKGGKLSIPGQGGKGSFFQQSREK